VVKRNEYTQPYKVAWVLVTINSYSGRSVGDASRWDEKARLRRCVRSHVIDVRAQQETKLYIVRNPKLTVSLDLEYRRSWYCMFWMRDEGVRCG
jgi:hypothetical protein